MKRRQGKAIPVGDSPHKSHILVVSSVVRELCDHSLMLQRFGYRVCAAQTGAQALELAALSRPSLVIADRTLPDMDCLDLLRKLSSDARSISMIVILPVAAECVEACNFELGGALPALTKPVAAEDLYRTVQAAIEPTPRATIRIRTSLPVKVNNTLLDCNRGECAIDLSAQGMYVRMLKPFRPNRNLKVTVNIGSRAVTAGASVLYTRAFGDGPSASPGMAVKFTAIEPDDQAFLASYIRGEVTKEPGNAER